MRNNLILLLVYLSVNQLVIAQVDVEKVIIGKIVSDSTLLEGISIVNSSNKRIAVSDEKGCFFILAKEGDLLNFSGIDYKYLRKYIYKHEYKAGGLEVNMMPISIELEEVIINKYAEITAENLGIIPRGQIKFTPQERRLYSGSGGIQGFFNLISGERDILKINVEIEKKELLLKKMLYLFGDEYYIETLRIPKELIKGFQYYCIEDDEFTNSLQSKNKTLSMFLIVGLAAKYNQNRMD